MNVKFQIMMEPWNVVVYTSAGILEDLIIAAEQLCLLS